MSSFWCFFQIMETFVSGYGKLDIDNDLLCIRLIIEEKKSCEKQIYIFKSF